ncbi:MAG TPA: zf-HC2 domain-containing protein [Gemmatimonadaceae bacterium]|jgi:hypothetical protein|nr:zf-HC2 domain-containing protein [Gemmatimonadaceae bacterium]
MTPFRFTHLSDEELSKLADGAVSIDELRDIDAHLSGCTECQQAVHEALRGLMMLSRASEPPADMEQHVRARRWSVARDPSSLLEEDEGDIAEVGGRGVDDILSDDDEAPSETEPDKTD